MEFTPITDNYDQPQQNYSENRTKTVIVYLSDYLDSKPDSKIDERHPKLSHCSECFWWEQNKIGHILTQRRPTVRAYSQQNYNDMQSCASHFYHIKRFYLTS
jgi:hypothetical protein